MNADNRREPPRHAQARKAADDRLAKALRDNLHRRKAQARARKNAAGKALTHDQKALDS